MFLLTTRCLLVNSSSLTQLSCLHGLRRTQNIAICRLTIQRCRLDLLLVSRFPKECLKGLQLLMTGIVIIMVSHLSYFLRGRGQCTELPYFQCGDHITDLDLRNLYSFRIRFVMHGLISPWISKVYLYGRT